MLKFALKNLAIKKVQAILIIISIVLSAGVGVLAYNVASQVSDGITSTAGYYSAIIGPSGSATQLAMNTMYFTDEPLGTIPFSIVTALRQDSRVQTDANGSSDNSVIPFAMADNYNGARVVGTSGAFIFGKELSQGEMFDDGGAFEVVLGYSVAEMNNLSIGDTILTGHSIGESHTQALKVVGILKKTNTAYDNIVFTQIKTIWELHSDEDEAHNEEHEEHMELNGTVCAVLVKTVSPGAAMSLVEEYNGKIFTLGEHEQQENYSLQAIEPMSTIRGVLDDVNTTKYIVYILCGIILAMNVMIIAIITLLNMYQSVKEVALMRLIGISMRKINLLYLIQNALIGIISVLLAMLLSRICLVFISDYIASMGVVLNLTRIYPFEAIILVAVFLISIIPTLISTSVMAGKDGVGE